MILTDIEKKHHFKYPELYKKLEQDGMLNVGEYGPDWYATVYPKLKDNPTLLLHSYDFELLSVHAVDEAVKELSDPEGYRQIRPELKFIPFGQTGAGDHYCFFITEQHQDDLPIVLVWHDSNEVNYLAENLQDYIFRAVLTDMSEQDTYNDVDNDEFRENLNHVLNTHTPYLTPKQTEILQDIFSREITEYDIELPKGRKESHRGLLTDKELNEILNNVIPFEKMDASFQYADE